jgi:hypothetical protein
MHPDRIAFELTKRGVHHPHSQNNQLITNRRFSESLIIYPMNKVGVLFCELSRTRIKNQLRTPQQRDRFPAGSSGAPPWGVGHLGRSIPMDLCNSYISPGEYGFSPLSCLVSDMGASDLPLR